MQLALPVLPLSACFALSSWDGGKLLMESFRFSLEKTEKNLCACTSGAPGAGVGVSGYCSPVPALRGISPLSSTTQVQTFSSNAFKLRLS